MAVSLQVKARAPTQNQFNAGIYASANVSIVVDNTPIVELRDANVRYSAQNQQFFVGPPSRAYTDGQGQKKYANYWMLLPGADQAARGAWTQQIIQQITQQIPQLGQPGSVGSGGQAAPQQAAPQQAAPVAQPAAQPQAYTQPQQAAPAAAPVGAPGQAPFAPQAPQAPQGAPAQPMAPQGAPAQPAQPAAPGPAAPGGPGAPGAPAAPMAQPPGQSFPLPG